MFFKPKIWHPIAVVLGVINWLGAGWALRGALDLRQPGEFAHTGIHVALALACGFWALHLRRARDRAESPQLEGGAADDPNRLDALGAEVSNLQRQLSETQERLDFAERMLAQRPVRVEPPRGT
jgi:hypothetical protein